jgi:T5SS/PEP-CTERM-associated repeat protein
MSGSQTPANLSSSTTTVASPLTLVSSNVVNGSVNATGLTTLSYVFSEPLDPNKVNAADFALTELALTNSFLIAVHQAPGSGDIVNGVNVQDNFLDSTGAYGAIYSAPTGSNLAFIGNVDLTNGATIAAPQGTGDSNVTQVVASPGGSAAIGTTVTLTVSMNETVTVTGTPTLSLNDGGTATYVGGSGSSALTFVYTVGANDAAEPALAITQANLGSSAGIFDAAGDPINLAAITQPIVGAPAIVSNGTGGSTGSGGSGVAPTYADGSAGAPAGTPQLPNLLSGYPVRPPWEVAGVDYAVGVPSGTVLKDPATISMAGVNLDVKNAVAFVTGNNVTLNGYDFSLNGGWDVYVTGTNDVIENSFFKVGTANQQPIGAGISASNLTIIDNTIDGSGLGVMNDPQAVASLITDAGTGLTVEYNWLENAPQHDVEFAGGQLRDEYNLIQNVGYYNGGHVNYIQFDGGVAIDPIVAFNTFYNPPHQGQPGAGEGVQIEAQLGSVILGAQVENNTIISPGPPKITVQPTSIQLVNGNTVQATYAPLGAGTYTSVLNGAGITDQNGNALGTGPINTVFTVTPATNEWVAVGEADWETPGAWLTGIVPTGTDTALMDLAAGMIATHSHGIDVVGTLFLYGQGTLDISGGMFEPGTLDVAGGNIVLSTGGTLSTNALFRGVGNLDFAGGRLIGGSGFGIQSGEVIDGFGMAGGTGELIVNQGTVDALAGTGPGQKVMTLVGTIAGQGALNISAGSTLELNGAVLTGTPVLDVNNNGVLIPTPSTQEVNFLGGSGELQLDDAAGFAGTITSFGQGDTIFLAGISVTGSSYSAGVLTLTDATGSIAIDLPGSFVTDNFVVTNAGTSTAISLVDTHNRILSWTGSASTAFGATANWNDLSDALNPAQTAPNATDTVQFNSSNGAVTGTGTVAVLDVASTGSGALQLSNGATILAGTFDAGITSGAAGQVSLSGPGTDITVTNAAVLADAGTGVLSILAGATFAAASLTIGAQANSSGTLDVSGSGSLLQISGALNVGTALGTGELTVGAGAAVHAAVVNVRGAVALEGGLFDPNVQYIAQGQTVSGFGTIEAAGGVVLDEGTITAGGSNPADLKVMGAVVGGGTLTIDGVQQVSSPAGALHIDAGGTLELSGPVRNAASNVFQDSLTNTYTVNNSVVDVSFADGTGVLLIDDIAQFGGTITTYQAGDSFVIANGTLSGLGVTNGDTLTVADAGNGGSDQLIFGSPISASNFDVVNGNTIQVGQVSCFAEGTRIETSTGPVAVEDLRMGLGVVTPQDGRCEPIVWIGKRTVHCARHPRPETVWPVRVRAGAFGRGMPVRELYLSPDHAVFVNGVLVPVKLLIDGTSIVQVKRMTVTYYHVELPRHAVILAEGLPVESYLDTGDRADLNEGSETIRLFPDFASRLGPDVATIWETHGAAPLVMTGPELAAARAAVAASASQRGPRSKRPRSKAA